MQVQFPFYIDSFLPLRSITLKFHKFLELNLNLNVVHCAPYSTTLEKRKARHNMPKL